MVTLPVASTACAEASELVGESIAGSAAQVRVWLAIEHCGAWARDALASLGIPQPVREQVAAWQTEIPRLRPQLIRKPGSRTVDAFRVYVALTAGGRVAPAQFDDMTFESLARLDLPAVVRDLEQGRRPEGSTEPAKDLVLVCTHGKRDQCCAVRGNAAYQQIARDGSVDAWQTTHLGGHRFAATCVVLPHGACYGRLTQDDVPRMLEAHRSGTLFDPQRYRGRCSWSAAGQAAIHFARAQTKESSLDAFDVVSETQQDGVISVELRHGSTAMTVALTRTPTEGVRPGSCGKAPEPAMNYEALRVQANT